MAYIPNPTNKGQDDRERAADDSAIRLHHFKLTNGNDVGVQKFVKAYDGQIESQAVPQSDVVNEHSGSVVRSHNDKAYRFTDNVGKP